MNQRNLDIKIKLFLNSKEKKKKALSSTQQNICQIKPLTPTSLKMIFINTLKC